MTLWTPPGSVAEAIALQQQLRRRVIARGDLSAVDSIGGVDVSSSPAPFGERRLSVADASGGRQECRPSRRWGERRLSVADASGGRQESPTSSEVAVGAVVVWSRSKKRIIAQATAAVTVSFPYIPGLLAFREMPALLAAWERLELKPEAIIVDGQGIAHPRRCGIACHLGLELGIPTVGYGKSRLVGWFEEPGLKKGDWTQLWDYIKRDVGGNPPLPPPSIEGGEATIDHRPVSRELIGRVVRTRAEVSPVFVSVGHLCDIEEATSLLLACCDRFRLPEPIRAAHRAAGDALRALK